MRIDSLTIRLVCVRCIALDILMLKTLKQTWFPNVRGDVLAGLAVALALIPEAIAFSIIAGVDPKVGLYASFCICAVIAVGDMGHLPDTLPIFRTPLHWL